MDTTVVKVDMFYLEHASGIVNGCRECGTNHHKGNWAIQIKFDGDATKYYLGFDAVEYPVCCGKEQPTYIRIFQTKLAAKAALNAARLIFDTEGIRALNIVSHHDFMKNAIYD